MKKLIKKSIAVTSALAMTLSMAPFASAAVGETNPENANGDVTVTDQFEGFVDKDVFDVTVPTVSAITFTLDPQGLLTIADDSTFDLGEGAVYFTNNGGTYSDTSDAIEVTNQSSYAVNANIELTLANDEATGITLVDDEAALANATTPSLYLAIAEGSNDAEAITAGTTEATKELAEVPEDQAGGASGSGYYVKVDSGDSPLGNNTYTYELGSSFTAADNQKASYTLTGACDSTSDWSDIDMSNLTVEIAWDITSASVAPTEAYSLLYQGAFWCCSGMQNSDVFDTDATISDVKVNGVAVTGTTINDQGYVIITWAQCEAAGGDALGVPSTTPEKTTKWVVEYTVNGTTYTTTYEQ